MSFKIPQWGQRPEEQPQQTLTLTNEEKAKTMNQVKQPEPAPRGPEGAAGKHLLAVRGSNARLEGKFEIADSIEIECELRGELFVGGKLTIGANGNVTADVQTVDAVILGTYSGNMTATGTIEIASTGRVSGNIQTAELVIARGALFTGNVAKPAEMEDAPQVGRTRSSSTYKDVVALVPEPGLPPAQQRGS